MVPIKFKPVQSAIGKIKKILILAPIDSADIKCALKTRYLDLYEKIGSEVHYFFVNQAEDSGANRPKDCGKIDVKFPNQYFNNISIHANFDEWTQDVTNFLQGVDDNNIVWNKLVFCKNTYGDLHNLEMNAAQQISSAFSKYHFVAEPSEKEWEAGNMLIGRDLGGEDYIIIGIETFAKWARSFPGDMGKVKHELTTEISERLQVNYNRIYWLAVEKNTPESYQRQPIFHLDMYLTLAGLIKTISKTKETAFLAKPHLINLSRTASTKVSFFKEIEKGLKDTKTWLLNLKRCGPLFKVEFLPLFVFFLEGQSPSKRMPFCASYNNCIVENTTEEINIYFPSYVDPIKEKINAYFNNMPGFSKDEAFIGQLRQAIMQLSEEFSIQADTEYDILSSTSPPEKWSELDDFIPEKNIAEGLANSIGTIFEKIQQLISDQFIMTYGFNKVEFIECNFPSMIEGFGALHCIVKVMERVDN